MMPEAHGLNSDQDMSSSMNQTPHSDKKFSQNVSKRDIQYKVICRMGAGTLLSILIGLLTYYTLANIQYTAFEREYSYLSRGIVDSAQTALSQAHSVAETVSEVYGTQFPDSSMWPYVARGHFGRMVAPMISLLGARNINHVPIVYPRNLYEFETFAYDFFDSDAESISGLGISPFGKGVYAFNESGMKYHDTTGVTNFSPYNIITPVFQVGNVKQNSPVVMYNTHAESVRGKGIDGVIDCFASNGDPGSCSTLTDFIFLVQDDVKSPAAIFYYPEIPAHNSSHLVGFVAVVLSWDAVLVNTYHDRKGNTDILLVLSSSGGTTVTYTAHNEKIEYMGEGDKHNKKYSGYGVSGCLDSPVGTASTSAKYTLVVYPTNRYYYSFVNSYPIVAGVVTGFVVIALISLFVLYDVFVSLQRYRTEAVQYTRKVFLRWVSHEIRTPLNAVYLGLTSLCDATKDTYHNAPTSSESFQELKTGLENSISVLDDFLAYSSFDSHNYIFKEVAIIELMESCVRSHSEAAVVKNIKTEYVVNYKTEESSKGGALNVMADIDRLREALNRVLLYSIHISPRGKDLIISVSWDLPIPQVTISVSNYGPSLNQDLICDGSSFDVSRLRTGSHDNLSLWIAANIFKAHGGSMLLTGTGDVGSTVSIILPHVNTSSSTRSGSIFKNLNAFMSVKSQRHVLPYSNSARSTDECEKSFCEKRLPSVVPSSTVAYATIENAHLPTLKILVVDDVLSNRKILARLLTQRGHCCTMAENGMESIGLVKKLWGSSEQFDVICMDYEMPVCDGPTAARSLRDMDCKIPIIGVTGNVLQEDLRYFVSQGASVVLPKPVVMKSLEEELRKLFSGGKLRGVNTSSYASMDGSFRQNSDVHDASLAMFGGA